MNMSDSTILVNLQRCTGCWTCSLACKVGNRLDDDTFWQTVRTLGSGEGIDRPAGEWPNLSMSWMPVWSRSCIKCPARIADGESPYCVHSCPNGALVFGDDVPSKLEQLRADGFRIFELPPWENSKEGIIYADRG